MKLLKLLAFILETLEDICSYIRCNHRKYHTAQKILPTFRRRTVKRLIDRLCEYATSSCGTMDKQFFSDIV